MTSSVRQILHVKGFPGGGGGFGGGFPGGFPGGGFQGGFSGGFPSMDEIFSQIFGNQAGGRTRRTRSGGPQTRGSFSDIGEDIQQSIRITFNEAVNGAKKTISTTPVTECTTCHGNGVKAGAKSVVCPGCKGTGHQVYSLGGFHVQQTCEKCHGSGEAIDKRDVCGSCDGAGVVRGRESVQVEIPAGCEDGMILEVRNKGDAPIEGKGPRGKLLVLIRVTPSPIFVRKGSDVYYTADIPLTTALLGGEITMPTVSGNVDVKIKSGAQPGDELRLRGKGTKKVRGTGHGDFYVKLKINIPTKLTPEQQDLVRKLDDSLNNRSSSSESSCSSSHRSGSG
ncbi:DnaJ-like protein [Zancudomyces culisetae]|uniref:DnaJ homolog 1, mitochondrial n=1 Tax=Zancudomyces culisetae TaxID=1213189 RepID=A0A1R1PZB1_ZANCU|nr:DnaJ-like protein [Zancudomyces culisetae]|eukprot:OMH86279.1 DnaJ-like protein [Zancudomyces culisetae]